MEGKLSRSFHGSNFYIGSHLSVNKHCKPFIKATVMQIEKALINDRFRVSNVS